MAPVGIEDNILVTMPRLENAESMVGNHSHMGHLNLEIAL